MLATSFNAGYETRSKPSPARIDMKVNEEVKDMLARAASLDGVDMKSFVISVALERARKVIAEHEVISLSKKSQQQLINALKNPSRPTQGMQQLMNLPDFATE